MNYLYCLFIVFFVTGCSQVPLPSSLGNSSEKTGLDSTFGDPDLIEMARPSITFHPDYNWPITKIIISYWILIIMQ